MIVVEKTFSPGDSYPLERIGRPEELLFFDIETTGFSGATSSLYLIGAVYVKDGVWNLIQWFVDRPGAEEEVLRAFFDFLTPFSTLVHFNGDTFDLPYLEKRCQSLGILCPLSAFESWDIYKKIRPFKKLLGLDSLKLKAVERFLGIYREDPYTGGQLIQVYQDYLTTGEDALYRMLMLHNEEDLMGMPRILPILSYPDFLAGDFLPEEGAIRTEEDLFGAKEFFLQLSCRGALSLPTPVAWDHPALDGVHFSAEDDRLELTIPLFDGELKYFYPDYKDYYYLIYEDTAIHKSVGEFVDKAARKKATAATCYTRRRGLFLPQTEPVLTPAFRKELRSKCSYGELPEDLMACPCLSGYVKSLVASSLPVKS